MPNSMGSKSDAKIKFKVVQINDEYLAFNSIRWRDSPTHINQINNHQLFHKITTRSPPNSPLRSLVGMRVAHCEKYNNCQTLINMIQEVFVPRDDSKDEHLIHRDIIFKYASRYIDYALIVT